MPPGEDRRELVARLRSEIRRLERRPERRSGAIPCGLPAIDALLPGGFPCGAISELRGGRASGKTIVALSLLAGLERGALAAWIDVRGELYPPAAAALGVELDRLLIVRPPGGARGGAGLWAAEALLGSGAFAAVVMDDPEGPPSRGAEVGLRRLVAAAEQGGTVGLWLSLPGAVLRPPAALRLAIETRAGQIIARPGGRRPGADGASHAA